MNNDKKVKVEAIQDFVFALKIGFDILKKYFFILSFRQI